MAIPLSLSYNIVLSQFSPRINYLPPPNESSARLGKRLLWLMMDTSGMSTVFLCSFATASEAASIFVSKCVSLQVHITELSLTAPPSWLSSLPAKIPDMGRFW